MNVAVLDGAALGTVEMVPSREFYDYVAKYTPGSTQYFVPARLSPETTARVCRDAETAYRALGCAGAARVDFIVAADGTPYILEVNTLARDDRDVLVPKIAAGKGIPFPELCERILDGASSEGLTTPRAASGAVPGCHAPGTLILLDRIHFWACCPVGRYRPEAVDGWGGREAVGWRSRATGGVWTRGRRPLRAPFAMG